MTLRILRESIEIATIYIMVLLLIFSHRVFPRIQHCNFLTSKDFYGAN
jgi:hypothetical protein